MRAGCNVNNNILRTVNALGILILNHTFYSITLYDVFHNYHELHVNGIILKKLTEPFFFPFLTLNFKVM